MVRPRSLTPTPSPQCPHDANHASHPHRSTPGPRASGGTRLRPWTASKCHSGFVSNHPIRQISAASRVAGQRRPLHRPLTSGREHGPGLAAVPGRWTAAAHMWAHPRRPTQGRRQETYRPHYRQKPGNASCARDRHWGRISSPPWLRTHLVPRMRRRPPGATKTSNYVLLEKFGALSISLPAAVAEGHRAGTLMPHGSDPAHPCSCLLYFDAQ